MDRTDEVSERRHGEHVETRQMRPRQVKMTVWVAMMTMMSVTRKPGDPFAKEPMMTMTKTVKSAMKVHLRHFHDLNCPKKELHPM